MDCSTFQIDSGYATKSQNGAVRMEGLGNGGVFTGKKNGFVTKVFLLLLIYSNYYVEWLMHGIRGTSGINQAKRQV